MTSMAMHVIHLCTKKNNMSSTQYNHQTYYHYHPPPENYLKGKPGSKTLQDKMMML